MTYDDWKSTDAGPVDAPPCCPRCGSEDADACPCDPAPPCDWCVDEAREHCAVCGQDLCAADHALHLRGCAAQADDDRDDRAMDRAASGLAPYRRGINH